MINICLCVHDEDGSYYRHALAAMASVMDHLRSTATVHVIADATVGEDKRERFHSVAREHGQQVCFVDPLPIDREAMRQVPLRFGPGSLYRLMIPALFPSSRVLYLDSDIICTVDVAPLFAVDLGQACIAACRGIERKDDEEYLQSIGADYRRYVNSGVILFNCPRIAAQYPQFLDGVMAIMAKGLRLPDQDAINSFFSSPGQIHFLPEEYNFCPTLYDRAYQAPSVLRGKILHYIHHKPWQCFYPAALPYWRYIQRCFPDADVLSEIESLPPPYLREYSQMLFLLRNRFAWKTVRRMQGVYENGLWGEIWKRLKGH